MKSIETLIEDIYQVLDKGAEVSEESRKGFSEAISQIIKDRLEEAERKPYLRISNLGSPCDRKLYYSINHPELAEPLAPHVRLKFLIGDVWEATLLYLASVAGHKVEGQQDEIDLHGVKGHRDAVIDGSVVDAKSASTYAFQKFARGLAPPDDSFGYLTQLDSYLEAGQTDPLVTNKSTAYFLVGDKTLGHLCLDKHNRSGTDFEALVLRKREMLSAKNPPPRGFDDEPEGKSGNRKLGVNCSYCEFKEACWPGLRTFKYANKPVFLTKVNREPKVPEIIDGKVIDDDPF